MVRRLKDSLQPALHMDLIDHSHSSRVSIEIPRVNYNTTSLDVFILEPSFNSPSWKDGDGDIQRKRLNKRKARTYEEQFPPSLKLAV